MQSLDRLRRALAATDAREPRTWAAIDDLPAPAARLFERRFAEGLTQAAVLIPLMTRGDEVSVLFTVRGDKLRNHAGQISFPGGRREPEDADAAANALREAREEVALAPESVEIIGYLDDHPTGTGFLVTPVVGVIADPPALIADGLEAVALFEVPLDFLLDRGNYERYWTTRAGVRVPYHALTYGQRFIWGATAGMLRELSVRAAEQR